MAASDAIPVPRKNTAYRFYFAIRKPSDSTLITTWTGMDSEVSLDGAGYSDCTNEAKEIGTTGTGYIDLTSSEMNADCVLLKVTVTNTGSVPLVFALYPETAGDYRLADTQKVDVETIKTQAVTCAAGVTVLASVGTAATSTAQTGDSFARIGATGSGLTSLATQTSVNDLPTNSELASALATADDAVLSAIAALNNLSAAAAAAAVHTTQMTESYAADGVAPTLAQALFLIQQAITEFTIVVNTGAGTSTTTIKRIDGSTPAATLTLNSETAPTAATRAT